MNVAEIKLNLINKITELKNNSIVEELQKILDFELDTVTYKLSKLEKERILKAEEELKNSELIDNDSVNKQIDTWLKEK
ncbi:MAG: hypothetical protein KDE33_27375 [Bacteroidetes bacterium]|nr:hypothetical protein [Bacteroidota bacterium]MCB9227337.1 hypothetical protein [Chitinophagales bacterium]